MLSGEIGPLKNEQFRALARISNTSTSKWSTYNGLLYSENSTFIFPRIFNALVSQVEYIE